MDKLKEDTSPGRRTYSEHDMATVMVMTRATTFLRTGHGFPASSTSCSNPVSQATQDLEEALNCVMNTIKKPALEVKPRSRFKDFLAGGLVAAGVIGAVAIAHKQGALPAIFPKKP